MGEQKHKNPQTFYRNVKHIMIFKDKDHLLLFCFIYFRKIEIHPILAIEVKKIITQIIVFYFFINLRTSNENHTLVYVYHYKQMKYYLAKIQIVVLFP